MSSELNADITTEDFFGNKLKDISNARIEAAIALALSELTNEKFVCSIKRIDYESGGNLSGAKIVLTISKKTDGNFFDKTQESKEAKENGDNEIPF